MLSRQVKQGLEQQGVTFLDKCPEFEEVMKLKVEDLRKLEPIEIAEYLYVLSQYTLYLVQLRNLYRIDYKVLSDEFDRLVSEYKGSTKKDKLRNALKDEKIKNLANALDILQAYNTMFTDLIESHRDIQNALKYMHSSIQ